MAKYISRLLPWGKGEPQARDDNLLPTSADSMRSTLPTLQGYGGHATLTTALFGIDSAQHLKLLKMAKVIVALLEDPRISMLEMAKAPTVHAVFRTALKLKIFEVVPEKETVSAEKLASYTGVERLLLVRLMRVLVSAGIFDEVGEELYQHNSRSLVMKHPTFRTFVHGLSENTAIMSKLPDFLSSINYKNPGDRRHALFQFANNTELNAFDWMQDHPEQLARFSAGMAAVTELQAADLRAALLARLPTKDDATQGMHGMEQEVLLVDVGGGRGTMLATVREQRPDLNGRLIAQDLPKEIEGFEPVADVEAMAYDFFTPQPIKGASIYFFCHIFHDWPDAACREILRSTLPALVPGKSKIVIVDVVVPKTGASAFMCEMDISMIAYGGMERTEYQWRQLLEEEGLKIVSIEGPKVGSVTGDSVIDAERVG